MNTNDAIILARKHVVFGEAEMHSSARVCLEDAIACYEMGDFESARARAAKAISYMVGVFHADYKRVAA